MGIEIIFLIQPSSGQDQFFKEGNKLNSFHFFFQVIQVLVQTPFIADGLRRCSNTRVTRLHKPGRELITFLIVANVALWVAETFLAGHRIHPDNLLSTVLGHMTQPLTMFYRFHSSVCLVDIWQSAYQTGN